MDVYDSIPTIVTTFVAIIAKLSIFIFLLEIVYYTTNIVGITEQSINWTSGLLISSLLSLIIGTVVGLSQFRIKRLFAYSTISHVGFILLALSISTVESTQAFVFYLIQYSLSNLNAFIILVTIGFSLYFYYNNDKEHKDLLDKNNSPALRCGKPLLWDKWPNSGKILKPFIPSHLWKWIDGWTNSSRKVIIKRICENKMDYRGSKSIPFKIKPNLCRTLHSSTATGHVKSCDGNNLEGSFLNPWFVTGFTDGEGSFMLSFLKTPNVKQGWQIQSVFQIALHEKDVELLRLIQSYFGGVGKIARHGKHSYSFRVRSLGDNVNKILAHFDKYPLISQKQADYRLWRAALQMMIRGDHLTDEGFKTILNIRASLNLGCSEDLKASFPQTIPVEKPEIADQKIPHPEWLAGFASGEGTFSIKATKTKSKLGFKLSAWFRISQHSRDKELLSCLISYLECGVLVKDNRGPAVEYSVYKFSDVSGKILPFFITHKILGVKAQDFLDWSRAIAIIQAKGHLTPEGVDEIINLKAKMNKGRVSPE